MGGLPLFNAVIRIRRGCHPKPELGIALGSPGPKPSTLSTRLSHLPSIDRVVTVLPSIKLPPCVMRGVSKSLDDMSLQLA